jgi:hypothetical protein
MKYGQQRRKEAPLKRGPSPPTATDSSTHYAGPSGMQIQDNAPLVEENTSLAYFPHMWMLSESTRQDNINVTPIADYFQRYFPKDPPGFAFDFRTIATDGLQLGSLEQGGHTYLPSPRDTHLVLQGMRTISGLLTNATILHLQCDTVSYALEIRISSSTPTPPALTPTKLQSSLPHLPYIDLLPFPSMRDKLLKSGELVNAYEIWSDFATGGFTIWGKTPWDKRGWEVHVDFAKKWWWLMSDEVVEEANFWRMERGDAMLNLEYIKE